MVSAKQKQLIAATDLRQVCLLQSHALRPLRRFHNAFASIYSAGRASCILGEIASSLTSLAEKTGLSDTLPISRGDFLAWLSASPLFVSWFAAFCTRLATHGVIRHYVMAYEDLVVKG
jgi:hypothetical protein